MLLEFKKFILFSEDTHEFSSVQINVPFELKKHILLWNKENIQNKDLYHSDHGGHGRETTPHITILYGIHSQNDTEIKKLLKNIHSFEIKIGKISKFTNNKDFDVVKFEIHSEKLHELHKKLKLNINNTQSHKEYNPHLTLAYVKKNHCQNLTYNLNEKFKVNNFIFSSLNGNLTEIPLI